MKFAPVRCTTSDTVDFSEFGWLFFFRCLIVSFSIHVFVLVSSSESRDSFIFSYMYSWIVSVIAFTDMSLFLIFFLSSVSPVDFPMTERNFDANSSAAVISSNSQFFSVSRIRFQVSAAVSPGSFFRLKKLALLWCLFHSGIKCSLNSAYKQYNGKEYTV